MTTSPSLPGSSKNSERDLKVAEPALSKSLGKSEAARSKLLDAGTRLIAERGIEGVNTNVVAREARLGVGTFYNHFEDKHELHRAIVLHGFEGLRAAVADASGGLGAERDELAAQVRAVVGAQVDFASAEPALFRVAFGGPAPTASHGRPAMTYSTRPVEQRLQALQRAGELDPAMSAEVAARGFAGMQTAVLLWWLDDRTRSSREELVETLVRLHPALAGRVAR